LLRRYGLQTQPSLLSDVYIQGKALCVLLPYLNEQDESDMIKEQLTQWYKQRAHVVIHERIEHYANSLNLRPKRVRINYLKSRWGSCSSRGSITFNWVLVMASLKVIDSVVVHELCHLKHLNHSRAFWKKVRSLIPHYKTCDKWLKQHEMLLQW